MSDDGAPGGFEGFAPVDFFFSEEVDCHQVTESKELGKKYLLPPLGDVFGEESFAQVFMGWHATGLFFQVQVQQENSLVVSYPDIRAGDSFEFFIDTRNIATAKTTHRFCHHFYFLPERFEGHMKGECTRFRTEDAHPLCADDSLDLHVSKHATGYTARIFIPKECLVGYDPQAGGRLGFTYRINRPGATSQHFAMAYEQSRIDTMPCLWAKLRLTGDT